jgi:hypothetical protein
MIVIPLFYFVGPSTGCAVVRRKNHWINGRRSAFIFVPVLSMVLIPYDTLVNLAF